MKRLYDWFWELMDEQEALYDQQLVAGFFGLAVLLFSLLVLWGIVAACNWLELKG